MVDVEKLEYLWFFFGFCDEIKAWLETIHVKLKISFISVEVRILAEGIETDRLERHSSTEAAHYSCVTAPWNKKKTKQ